MIPMFTCCECGGNVVETAKVDRTFRIRKGVYAKIPNDFLIPTCQDCGVQFFNAELAGRLEKLLLPLKNNR